MNRTYKGKIREVFIDAVHKEVNKEWNRKGYFITLKRDEVKAVLEAESVIR